VTQGEGVLQMRTSALLGAKNFAFFSKFMVYPYEKRGQRVELVLASGKGLI